MAATLYAFVSLGLLFLVLALPLMLRWAKPNPLYGFRTPKTLSDPLIWYDSNAYAGRLLVGTGVLILVMAIGLYYLVPNLPPTVYVLAMGVVTVAGVLASLFHALRYLRRFDGQ